MKTAEEILKSKLNPSIAIINKPDYTFNKVIEAMEEYANQFKHLHLHSVMQAEGSDASEGAAVGNSAAGQSGSAWCSCEMPIPDMSYTCFKCGKMIDFERGGSAKGALPR